MTIGFSTTEIELAGLARWTAVAPPIGAAERRARLAAAQERMTEIGAAALLVNAGPSLRYFTGVAWAPSERRVAMLLPAAGEPRSICPAFEQGSLDAELAIEADMLPWEEDEDPVQLVGKMMAPGEKIGRESGGERGRKGVKIQG